VVDEGWCCIPSRSLTDIVPSPSASRTNSGESVYHRQWNIPTNQSKAPAFTTPGTVVQQTHPESHRQVAATNKHEDDAKLLFGVVYSLRNMTRRLSSPYSHLLSQYRSRLNDRDDQFISYRTSKYKLHYYETPTLLKFVMITDAMTDNKRVVLHQIYVSLYVEFVVKNPLREIDGPVGVETFHLALDQFVRTLVYYPLYFEADNRDFN
jgi:trafficking protein particle complex subunit 1